jgi:hypothetical protein
VGDLVVLSVREEQRKFRNTFPEANIHHIDPESREGPTTERNLFPWNRDSHTAWHDLFLVLNAREVWDTLQRAWLRIWSGKEDDLVPPNWLTPYREVFCSDHLRKSKKAKPAKEWRKLWIIAFNTPNLSGARYIVQAMLLCQVFGYTSLHESARSTPVVRQLWRDMPRDRKTAQAFHICFGRSRFRISFGEMRKHIAYLQDRTVRARQ